jgi:hypothetical protein
MSRGRGGYIGFNRVPASGGINSAASGVWTLREAEALKRAGTWPTTFSDPTSISGLQLWLDAAAPETLFDATSGGSLVAADGTVKRWEDKSGNGRHATEATNGPTRKTNVQNGRDSLDFDGTNDTLQIASSQSTFSFLHKSTPATVFIVYRPSYSVLGTDIATGFHPLIETGSFSGLNPGFDIAFNNVPPNSQMIDLRVTGSGDGRIRKRIDSGAPNNSFSLLAVVTDLSQSTSSNRALLYRNGGSSSGTTLTGSPFDSGSISTANSGRNFTISGSGTATGASTSAFFNGDISEIIIYNSALSDTERAAVENSLLAKWAIT